MRAHSRTWLVVGDLAEIRHLAGLPQQANAAAPMRHGPDIRLPRQGGQRFQIGRVVPPHQARTRRRRGQRSQQGIDVREIKLVVAPRDLGQRLERVRLDCPDQIVVERRAVGGGAERAVAHPPPGPPRDLRHLGSGQGARAVAVELEQAREGDMVHVHVQPHADGVGRHQEVDLFVLIQLDLRIAGARAEPAHDNSAAAAPPADQLGDRVDLARAKRDDGAARRQSGKFLRSDMGQLRQARTGLDLRLRYEPLQQRPNGLGAQEHGFDQTARVQQPLSEDMPAVGIRAELDFVDRQELHQPIQRHSFHGA